MSSVTQAGRERRRRPDRQDRFRLFGRRAMKGRTRRGCAVIERRGVEHEVGSGARRSGSSPALCGRGRTRCRSLPSGCEPFAAVPCASIINRFQGVFASGRAHRGLAKESSCFSSAGARLALGDRKPTDCNSAVAAVTWFWPCGIASTRAAQVRAEVPLGSLGRGATGRRPVYPTLSPVRPSRRQPWPVAVPCGPCWCPPVPPRIHALAFPAPPLLAARLGRSVPSPPLGLFRAALRPFAPLLRARHFPPPLQCRLPVLQLGVVAHQGRGRAHTWLDRVALVQNRAAARRVISAPGPARGRRARTRDGGSAAAALPPPCPGFCPFPSPLPGSQERSRRLMWGAPCSKRLIHPGGGDLACSKLTFEPAS